MKQLFSFMFTLVVLSTCSIFGQTYSNGTGGGLWTTPSTWLGGVVPTATTDVIITGTDSVYLAAGAQCKNLTIQSGGKLSSAVDSISASGTFTLESDAWYYNNSSKGSVPGTVRSLDPGSYVVHTKAGTVGGTNNLEFGNLIVRMPSGTTAAGNLVINGNLTIHNAVGQVFKGSNATYPNTHVVVHGNVYLEAGVFSVIDIGSDTAYNVFDVDGDFIVSDTGRVGVFSAANAAGKGILNIKGNFVINGGRLQAGTSSTPGLGTGIINLYKNFTISSTSAIATNHQGQFAINFVGSGTQTVKFGRSVSFSTMVSDTISPTSNVVFDNDTAYYRTTVGGDFVVRGSLELKGISAIKGLANFTLNPGSTLKIGSPLGLTNDSTGNIQVTGTRTFTPEANYELKGTTAQVLGVIPASVAGFNVNNPTGITLDRDLTIFKNMKILSGDLDLNGFTVTMAPDAVLTETNGNTVKGATGKLSVTKDLNAPNGVNAGGLGAVITSTVNMGSTVIERYHAPRTGSGNQGIARYYKITPTNNTNLNAKLRLYYDESELNGNTEANLIIQRSLTGADGTWMNQMGAVTIASNYVEALGVPDMMFVTLVDKQHLLPVENEEKDIPTVYSVAQNYPNPFNPSTRISFTIPEMNHVSLKVYDVLGKEVATLINEVRTPGRYEVMFDMHNALRNTTSGVYFYTLKAGAFSETRKMLLIK